MLTSTRNDFWLGVIASIPFAPNALAFGAIVGVASNAVGATIYQVLLSAFAVNAATSQLASLEFWKGTLGFSSVMLATALLNAKHVLHSASLWAQLRTATRSQLLLIGFAITDSSWLCCQIAVQQGKMSPIFALSNAWSLLFIWISGCVCGFYLGGLIKPDQLEMFGISSIAVLSMAAIAPKAAKNSIHYLLPGLTASITAIVLMMSGFNEGESVLLATLAGTLLACARHDN